MDYNMQTPPPPTPVQEVETNKTTLMWLMIGAVVLALILWWRMSRSDIANAPNVTPTPAVQTTDADLQELNSIDANQNLDAEFQQIDQDLKTL